VSGVVVKGTVQYQNLIRGNETETLKVIDIGGLNPAPSIGGINNTGCLNALRQRRDEVCVRARRVVEM